jgi:recombination protein RecR
MITTPQAIRQLTRQFNRLPGIGQRTSERFVYWLLQQPEADVATLAQTILNLRSVRRCQRCFTYTEAPVCAICNDTQRNQHTLCVVAEARDMAAIEQTGTFDGLYHVLGGVIDHTRGLGPAQLRIAELVERIKTGTVTEIILATNPDSEGETTALYIVQELHDIPVTITRIARGLPVGADIEFADELTLANAMTARRKM